MSNLFVRAMRVCEPMENFSGTFNKCVE